MFERKDVSFSDVTITIGFLLNSIVCQVDDEVLLVEIVIIAGQADVRLFEKMAFMLWCDHDPTANVKFALAYQEGPLDVFLEDKHI